MTIDTRSSSLLLASRLANRPIFTRKQEYNRESPHRVGAQRGTMKKPLYQRSPSVNSTRNCVFCHAEFTLQKPSSSQMYCSHSCSRKDYKPYKDGFPDEWECKVCDTMKPIGDFYRHASGRPRAHRCKKCHKSFNDKWLAKRTPEQRKAYEAKHALYRARMRAEQPAKWRRMQRRANLIRFGLTPEQFEEMLSAQDGKCAICGDDWGTKARDGIDHCHETGKVRGLLCQGCNAGLGRFKDDPQRLRAAADYLERTGTAFPTGIHKWEVLP